jgi:hypothetical protein
MKQLTIRTVDPKLEAELEKLSRKRQWSLNQTATYLLRVGLGLTEETIIEPIGNGLDEFFGVWSTEESSGFDKKIDEQFSQIDPDVWS